MMDFKKLDVYSKVKYITTEIYRITDSFPKHELYSLTNQLRRAAISSMANIAEGASRFTDKDLAHFLQISIGSISELQALVEVAEELKYIDNHSKIQIENELIGARKMLINLNKRVRDRAT